MGTASLVLGVGLVLIDVESLVGLHQVWLQVSLRLRCAGVRLRLGPVGIIWGIGFPLEGVGVGLRRVGFHPPPPSAKTKGSGFGQFWGRLVRLVVRAAAVSRAVFGKPVVCRSPDSLVRIGETYLAAGMNYCCGVSD